MHPADTRKAVARIAAIANERSLTIACAESLTAGAIASELARGERASSWFAGAVVSYRSEIKFRVLGVTPGPVVTGTCAQEMVDGICSLMDVDAAVAVTGVGGPDEEEGKPAGTVFIATRTRTQTEICRHHFNGQPSEVLEQTVDAALGQLLTRLQRL